MTRTVEELRYRIAGLRAGEERMDTLDWIGRQWVASMMADACIIADELEERLNADEVDQAVADELAAQVVPAAQTG